MKTHQTWTVIPALDGWSVATLIEETSEFVYSPIIAWRIGLNTRDDDQNYCWTDAHPITAGTGDDSLGPHSCIKMSNGEYEFPEDRTFDNAGAAIEYIKAELDRERRARQVAPPR
jgi:hypothetical protein